MGMGRVFKLKADVHFRHHIRH